MPLNQINDWMLSEEKDEMLMYFYGQTMNVSAFSPDN